MADVASSLNSWSTTPSSNLPAGSTAVGTGMDDNLREIQAVVRTLASTDTIASGSTTDLSTVASTFVSVSGITTITSFGIQTAGIYKWLVFAGSLVLTHHATSLILPTGASITTAAGDVALMLSAGSGNWRCLSYLRANGQTVAAFTTFADGTVGAPGLAFTNDTNTGLYRIGADSMGIAVGGVLTATFSASGTTLTTTGDGDNMTVSTANASAAAAGGVTVSGGTGGTSYAGGGVTISGGAGGSSTGAAGAVTIAAGDSSGTSNHGGAVAVTAGDAAGSSANGGAVSVTAGHGAAGNGGAITITGGTSYQGTAGSVTISAGTGSDPNSSANGGQVLINGGDGKYNGHGSDIKVAAGNGGTGGSATNAGDLFLAGGLAYNGGDPGNIYLSLGEPSATMAVLIIDGDDNHPYWANGRGSSPSISAGAGSGGSRGIAGVDQAFIVTMGGTSPTSVTVAFGNTWTTAPVVTCSTSKAGVSLQVVSVSTTSVQIDTDVAWADGDKLYVTCVGYA